MASNGVKAVIFDTDGVITDTAAVHAAAWKQLFDSYLERRAEGGDFTPFDPVEDYRRYVDGKPRYDGVASFLESRGISLPPGDPSDPPAAETICGLGNQKNQYFVHHLRSEGVEAFESTVEFIHELQAHDVHTAVISASKNCKEVLEAAGVLDLFEVRVDGVLSAELGLAGKPDPAVFLEAARRLGVSAQSTAIVEDAIAGVQAGRRGDFGFVIGVDRTGHPEDLASNGADVVVSDLSELTVDPARRVIPTSDA